MNGVARRVAIAIAISFLVALAGARTARALDFPADDLPIVLDLDGDTHPCVLLPKPAAGECDGLDQSVADDVAGASSVATVHGFALLRPEGDTIALTETEIERGTYGHEKRKRQQLVDDYVSGFSGKPIDPPEVDAVGDPDADLGQIVRIRMTIPSRERTAHYRAYFFFEKKKVHVVTFSGGDPAVLDAVVDRTMKTAVRGKGFDVDRSKPLSSAVVGGIVLGMVVVLVGFAVFVGLLLRRQSKPTPAYAQPPYAPHGQPSYAPYGQPPYGQAPSAHPPQGAPPHPPPFAQGSPPPWNDPRGGGHG